MTEAEVLAWLGISPADFATLPEGVHLRPDIIAGMAGVPPPGEGSGGPAGLCQRGQRGQPPTEGDREQLRVFAAFLACAGPVGRTLFVRDKPPEE